jgi:hypothetical protein
MVAKHIPERCREFIDGRWVGNVFGGGGAGKGMHTESHAYL